MKRVLNRGGFSLIEAVIGIFVSSLILLAVATQMGLTYQASSSVERNLDFNELISNIKKTVSEPALCSKSLLGQTPAVGRSVNILYGMTRLNDNYNANFNNGKIKITSMKWTAVVPVTATETIGWFSVTADLQTNSNAVVGGNSKTFPQGPNPPGIMVDLLVNSTGQIVGCGADKSYPYQYTVTVAAGGNVTGSYIVMGFGGPAGSSGNFEFAMGSGTIMNGQVIPLPAAGWAYANMVMGVDINDAYHDRETFAVPYPILGSGPGFKSSDGYFMGIAAGVNPANGMVAVGAGGDGHPHYQPGTARARWTSYGWRILP